MNVDLYKFSKRINSTKLPPANTGKTFSCQLKDETSFINPVLKFDRTTLVTGVFSPSAYNYAVIDYWQRCYYITDWKFINGVWEAYLTVDVLASFKTEIGNTTAYITRSAYTSNGDIIDTFYPAKTNVSIVKTNVACAWYNVAPSGGSYVLGVINYDNANKIGAINYFALTSSQLASLLNYLFTNNIFNSSSITEIGEGLYKSLFNPFQYIVSCIWFPFAIQAFGSASGDIKVGYWSTGVSGIVVSSLAEKTFVTATLPDHPQISRGAYLNHAPYARHTLYIPPFGSIPIDTNFITIGKYLYSAVLVDHITGQATIRLALSPSSSYRDEYNIMCERSGLIGVPIQLAQVMTDYVNTVSSVSDVVSSAFNLNIGGIFKGLTSAVESQMPKVSTSGANGSFVETLQYPYLVSEFLQLVDENNTEFGKPLCANRQISAIPGYIECGEDDHSFSGTKAENEEINRFLKEGFFYE